MSAAALMRGEMLAALKVPAQGQGRPRH